VGLKEPLLLLQLLLPLLLLLSQLVAELLPREALFSCRSRTFSSRTKESPALTL
jgi:hypothetical protein